MQNPNNVKQTLLFNQVSILAAASRAMLDGHEHMVVPVIGIREGVLNGILYPAETLKANAAAWNGVPIPVTHPKDKDGKYITANSADVEATLNIGRFLNVNFEDKTKALKGELWINIKKATDLGHADLLARLDKGENIDVSTGLWTNADNRSGNFQGKSYSGTVSSFDPDHLAILPNEVGACSVKDGCGTFLLNESKNPCCDSCASKGDHDHNHEEPTPGFFGNAFKRVGHIFGFTANETSHNELREKLSTQLRGNLKGNNKWQYIVDVYKDFFVYEQDDVLFKQKYKQEKDDSVSFDGEATQVIIKKQYKEVLPQIATNQEKNKMKQPHITALAAMLAANTIDQAQHDSMSALPDAVLDNLLPKADPAPAAPVVNAASPLSEDDRQLLDQLKADREDRIISLRAHLKANCKAIPDAVVDTMNIQQMEAIVANAQKAAPATDFSLAPGAADLKGNSDAKAYVAPSILLAPATAG